MQAGAYGHRLATSFDLEHPPTLSSQTSGAVRLAVTELQRDSPDYGFTAPIAREPAYLLGLQLRALHHHELWLDGHPVAVRPITPGTTHIYDLERDPIAYLPEPFHPLFFYVPRSALVELSEELGSPPVNDLHNQPGQFIDDPIINHLGHCLIPPLRAAQHNHQLYVDHVLLALRMHLLATYGGVRCPSQMPHGGLAPWQQRQAMELMREHLVDGIPLALVAKACDLSCSAFVRAFKQSTGESPHQWLILRRIDLAMQLMHDRNLPLTDIAYAAGFADQSHFTRMFTRKMGMSPGVWRNASGYRAATDSPII